MPIRISKNRVSLENIPLNLAPEVDVASAATTNIGAATSNNVRITGTTTVTAFDTVASGVLRFLRFASALTLTHNATSLILPGAANITTAAGDSCLAVSLGSGNWIVHFYQATNAGITTTTASQAEMEAGTEAALRSMSPLRVKQAITAADRNDLVLLQTVTANSDASITIGSSSLFTSTYKKYMIVGSNIHPATDNVEGMTRVSIASSVKSDATYQYSRLANSSDSSAFSGLASQTGTAFANLWAQSGGNASGENCGFVMYVDDPAATDNYKIITVSAGSIALSGQIGTYFGTGYYGGALGALDGIQFYYSSGNIASGTFKLYGLK